MTTEEAVRLCASLAQCEIALVRRDAVAPALLAQAARHAEGLPPGPFVAEAARLARAASAAAPAEADALRKAVQALCRAAAIATDARLLGPPGPTT